MKTPLRSPLQFYLTLRLQTGLSPAASSPLPACGRAVPGMIHYAAAHARQIQRELGTFRLSRLRKAPGMQYVDSIFGELLKPIDRRQFREIVERHDGDAYDKSFRSWDHLVTMVGAQLGGVTSLRAVESSSKANSHQHYHLGVTKAPRSTLSRANARRPVGVFAETFAMLARKADRNTRMEGAEMVRLIDSSPIPLGKMCEWAEWNGRIRGMKMHVVYDPGTDVPRCIEITPATINDVEIGRQTELEAGATYVFDKGYYHYGWWKKINAANAFFVTRVKVNTRLRKTKSRYVRKTIGDGFRILDDADVMLASKGDSKLPIPLRRIKVKRDEGGTITLVTNDLKRTAVEIATLYKSRWQIELLFRWIKQHLNLRKFMGKNDNAIRLQLIAAMIAYLLLRLAHRLNSLPMLHLRFAELVCQRLFMRKPIAKIDTPPPVNPSKPRPKFSPDQLRFDYA
jgi:putative transposase